MGRMVINRSFISCSHLLGPSQISQFVNDKRLRPFRDRFDTSGGDSTERYLPYVKEVTIVGRPVVWCVMC